MNSGLQRLKKITKNRVESIRLLESALNKKDFIDYILIYFSKEQILEEIDFTGFKEKLSENEFQQLHYLYHYPMLWDILNSNNFSTIDASNPIKWISISLQLIMNDIIQPYYLAYVDSSKNGKNNIIEALRLSEQGNDKQLFNVSRAILRRMFGAIQERGKKGIYQDIPFAIAWWKIYLTKEISKQTQIDEKTLYEYFNTNPTNYNELIMRMSSKLTVIADNNIRDGLLKYIIDKEITNTKNFKEIIRMIGIESSWRAMGSLNYKDNQKIIESLVA